MTLSTMSTTDDPVDSIDSSETPIDPELQTALNLYNNLHEKCGFQLNGSAKSTNNMPYLGGHELLTKHPELLPDISKQALIDGMPKIYAALQTLDFPNLNNVNESGFMKTGKFYPIHLIELVYPGRCFGTPVSLLNDSVETITEKLIEAITGTTLKDRVQGNSIIEYGTIPRLAVYTGKNETALVNGLPATILKNRQIVEILEVNKGEATLKDYAECCPIVVPLTQLQKIPSTEDLHNQQANKSIISISEYAYTFIRDSAQF